MTMTFRDFLRLTVRSARFAVRVYFRPLMAAIEAAKSVAVGKSLAPIAERNTQEPGLRISEPAPGGGTPG